MNTQKVVGIIGWKNSGKTGLMERLILEFKNRGQTVCAIKHAHHSFEIDHKGTDSFRYREAGAREVIIASGQRWAKMHEISYADEPPLEALLAEASPCDLILVEGYKNDTHRKIEARRLASKDKEPLCSAVKNVIAIASDHRKNENSLPFFNLNDTQKIADFIDALPALDLNKSHD